MEFALRRRIGSGHFREALRGLWLQSDDRILTVGDEVVRVFGAHGKLRNEWKTATPGFSIAVDGEGHAWVGQHGTVEIFDREGRLVDTWRAPEGLGLVTAIGFAGEDVFFADAHARWIHRYHREGRFLNHIGDKHRKGGFHIPNGIVDFAIDSGGVLHVANPGMHRVERYRPDGTLLGHFGRFDGQDPRGFPGCCNPTNVTVDAVGRVIVTEKAGPRAKIYSPEGELLAVVTDTTFDPAAKNMDVAVDSGGRIYVADTVQLDVCVFEAGGAEATR